MKNIFILLTVLSIGIVSFAQTAMEVSTGDGYANDVYYSFENGEQATSPRSNWDLAFATNRMDINILANIGMETELYTYPYGDINDWENVDIANIASWTPMYNSVENMYEGAFLQNIDPNNQFDFGWGIYSMSTHHITGDSLFVFKTVNGNYKKLWIVDRNPNMGANTWLFKYANIDGSDEQEITIEADNYLDKNFIFFSLDDNLLVDKEPASAEWDLQFTRYFDQTIPYFVTGVKANSQRITIQQVDDVDQATFEDYDESMFTTHWTEIGSDWKFFDLGNFEWIIEENRVYFAKVMNEDHSDSS
jgi:hypothetical protein